MINKKESNRKWREKNKERIKEYNLKYNREHKKELKEHRMLRRDENLKYAKQYMEEHREQKREYTRNYWRTHKDEYKKYRLEHPEIVKKTAEKYKATHRVEISSRNKAIHGVKLKEICELCGQTAKQRHHPDYLKPLEVMHLCIQCHNDIHKGLTRKEREG